MKIMVECHAGYRGEEAPRRFSLGERTIEVEEVADRWMAPDHAYFKVRDDHGNIYILRHDVEARFWELWMYDKSGRQVG